MRNRIGVLLLQGMFAATVLLPAVISHTGPISADAAASSLGPVMQPVNVPARVSRVATVANGSGEAWALGLTSVSRPGWPAPSGNGTLVVLHYQASSGWRIQGPPLNASGAPFNPSLSDLAVGSNGEGWAVGDSGTLLHHAPGNGPWQQVQAGQFGFRLAKVSLAGDGGGLFGFAVGDAGNVLRLSGGTWSQDAQLGSTTAPDTCAFASTTPSLTSVSAVNADEAWAVAGNQVVQIYHRSGGAWSNVQTGKQMFDCPSSGGLVPTESTTVFNQQAVGSAVAADRGGAWIGGEIFPTDPAHPFGNQDTGDKGTPFALLYDGHSWTSFCPNQYITGAGGKPISEPPCQRDFPSSGFVIAAMAKLGDTAFAGGDGMFQYVIDPSSGGTWRRAPDSIGFISSLSMQSPLDGWAASSGDTVGQPGSVHGSTLTIGHWTVSPVTPAGYRWPQYAPAYAKTPIQAITLAPDGSGHGLAVAGAGWIYHYDGGAWDNDTTNRKDQKDLHAVSWPAMDRAYVVGQQGDLLDFDGQKWNVDPQAFNLSHTRSLFGVAFDSRDHGYAVGVGGTILEHTAAGWAQAAGSGMVSSDLLAVAQAGGDYIAVGSGGTVLENRGGTWNNISAQMPSQVGSSDLQTVSVLPDGTVVLGGTHGLLSTRQNSAWSIFPDPIDANYVSLSARRDSGGQLRILASVNQGVNKFTSDTLTVLTTLLFYYDGGGWRDVQNGTFRQALPTQNVTDAPQPLDPSFSVVLDGGGLTGWAVGGSVANVPDDQGHLRSEATSTAVRVDFSGASNPPNQVDFSMFNSPAPAGTVRFAMFSGNDCGTGLCAAAQGTGTIADNGVVQTISELNTIASLPGAPKFAVYGGDMRRQGLPDELSQFKQLMGKLRMPWWAAMGPTDLFGGIQTNGQIQPPGSTASSSFYLDVFKDMPKPWGGGTTGAPVPPGFSDSGSGAYSPAAATPGSSSNNDPDHLARTHYAIDYHGLRLAFVDSSSIGLSAGDSAGNENPNESSGQLAWLQKVLPPTGSPPAVVITSVPTQDPDFKTASGWSDATAFESAVAANTSIGAVLTGAKHRQGRYQAPAAVGAPYYMLGADGAAVGDLPYNPSAGQQEVDRRTPTDGRYHAWSVVDVDTLHRGPDNRPLVKVTSLPMLDSVTLHAFDGLVAPAGSLLHFSGQGRGLQGGWPQDPYQARAEYINFPIPFRCGATSTQGYGACVDPNALVPAYHYFSDNEKVAYFTKERFPGVPLLDGSTPVHEVPALGGVLCLVGAGYANVGLEVGFHRVTVPIVSTSGSGPCQKVPQILPSPAPVPTPPVVAKPVPAAPAEPVAGPGRFIHILNNSNAGALVPPPPGPAVAPAPPPAAGSAKKEERQKATESAGADKPGGAGETEGTETHSFTALHSHGVDQTGFAAQAGAFSIVLLIALGFLPLAARRPRANPGQVRGWGDRSDG